MNDEALLARITTNPQTFGGKPLIRGERLAVEQVLRMLAPGMTQDEVLGDYPWLEREDIQACLLFALRAYQTLAGERVEMMTLDSAS